MHPVHSRVFAVGDSGINALDNFLPKEFHFPVPEDGDSFTGRDMEFLATTATQPLPKP